MTDVDVAATAVISEVGQIAGTLAYMSPEQARGNPDEIDLRSDVYSLGVILYEFLTGKLPYEIHQTQLPEAVRTICEESPRRPSALVPTLRGDLETIALKALEKAPARRYQSALALLEDVERYLTDQPILARPPSAAYQLRKLVARHKPAFAFGATVLILLIAGAITMSVMFGVQRRERLRADAARGREVTVREVLNEAAQGIETSLAEQPEVQAAVRSTIGRTYIALGLYDAAEPQLRAALATRKKVHGETHGGIADSQHELAVLLHGTGDYASAEALFRESLAMRRNVLGAEHPDVATSLDNLGVLLRDQGRYDEAEPLLRKALDMRRQLLGSEHTGVATSLNNLASVLQDQDRLAEAEPLYREALDMYTQLHGRDHPEVATTLNNLASVYYDQGDYVAAETLTREALDLWRRILGDSHARVSAVISNLALLVRLQGRPEDAIALMHEVIAMRERLLGKKHPHVAYSLLGLAFLHMDCDDPEAAEPLLRESLRIFRETLPEDHWQTAYAENALGSCLADQGRCAEGEPLLLRSWETIKASPTAAPAIKLKTLERMIALYEAWDKPDEAAKYGMELRELEE